MIIRNIFSILSITVLVLAACNKDSSMGADATSGTGKGGSLARFTIAGNYLYLADWSSLKVFDISNPQQPVQKPTVNVGFGIETIFPYKDKLFIGSTQGMYIYTITNPATPIKQSSVQHLRSCDPVVANDSIAYVTLRGDDACGPAESGLYIYDIRNIAGPIFKKIVPLSNPFGLALADSVVFVCRGFNGLSAVNVKNPLSPVILYTKSDGTYLDVIPYDNLLICYVSNGILIYDATDLRNIVKIGTMNF